MRENGKKERNQFFGKAIQNVKDILIVFLCHETVVCDVCVMRPALT